MFIKLQNTEKPTWVTPCGYTFEEIEPGTYNTSCDNLDELFLILNELPKKSIMNISHHEFNNEEIHSILSSFPQLSFSFYLTPEDPDSIALPYLIQLGKLALKYINFDSRIPDFYLDIPEIDKFELANLISHISDIYTL